MVTRSLQMAWILVIDGRNYGSMFKVYYLKNGEHFLQFLLLFWNPNKILVILKKKDQPHSLYISEGIDFDKCG